MFAKRLNNLLVAVVIALLPLTTNAQESGFTVSTTGGSGLVEGVAGYSETDLAIAKALNYGPADAALFAESRDAITPNAYTSACIFEDDADRRCHLLQKSAFKEARDESIACVNYDLSPPSNYDVCQAAKKLGYGYSDADEALYLAAQANTVDNEACVVSGGLPAGTANACGKLTKTVYNNAITLANNCSDYPTIATCNQAKSQNYALNATDAALFNTAQSDTVNNPACINTASLATGTTNACSGITKAQYVAAQNLTNVCSVYSSFAICQTAQAQSYALTAADATLYNAAQSDAINNDACISSASLAAGTSSACSGITKAQYIAAKNLANACSAYSTFAICQTAQGQSYALTAADATLYNAAQSDTANNEACITAASLTAGTSAACSGITKVQYVAAKNLAAACSVYSTFALCQSAETLAYGKTSADATLYAQAVADTANNSACITLGSLAAGTSNACSQLTKTQYNGIATLAAANQAVLDAVGDDANADALTVAQLTSSDVYTNFASHGTSCSTVPSVSDVTANFSRFQHFMKKASFASNTANAAKQLCFATGNHTDLTWHNDAPTSYIIAANNSVTSQADWRNCGFWGKRTAISNTSTNAMKAAGNTIIYDVKAQDASVKFTAPTISSDKGHAVLNYNLSNQGVVSGASATLSVLAKNAGGYITASSSDRNVSVTAQNKIQTNDAIYNVFQKTASSSTWTLRNGINSPGSACPSGYSLVSTTSSPELDKLHSIAVKHGTGAGTMPSGNRMEQCANQFLECNAGFSACSNPNGSNWRMRLMIYGEKNGQTCAVTRKKAPGGGFYADKTDWPSGFSMYPPEGKCADVGAYSGNPRLANGCVGWCWVRALCKKNGAVHTVWP